MISIRTIADITADRQVILTLPPETPLGKVELTVTISPQPGKSSNGGNLRRWFGVVHSGDRQSADNRQIDADLAHTYGDTHE